MSKKVIVVALDINNVPYINNTEVILTPGEQKIWYTAKTQSIEIPGYINFGDIIINKFIKKFMKKSRKRDLLKFSYFTNRVAEYLKTSSYDEIIFENSQLEKKILPNFKNGNEYIAKNSKTAKKLYPVDG